VEVLVALTVMAVLAGIAWQGIDAMARTREASQAAVDRTLRVGSVLAQWEADLQALSATGVVPALQVQGQGLGGSARLTREAPGGVRMVVWTLRAGAAQATGSGIWQRWQGPAVTEAGALREQWLQSQQLLGNEPGTVAMLDGVGALQIYFHRDRAWTNAQSSGDQADNPMDSQTNNAPTGDGSATGGVGSGSGSGSGAGASAGVASRTAGQEKLPNAVRLVLNLPQGALTRDILLGPQP
jgi:general secretion pathway protein J